MSRRLLPLVLLAPAAALLCACSPDTNLPVSSASASTASSGTPAAVILLEYDSFEPSRVTIHVGQTVEWKWEESPTAGNVTFASLASPTMASGTWSRTFDAPGTYRFHDTLSQQAAGVVTVLP